MISLGNDFVNRMNFCKDFYCTIGNHDYNSYEQLNSKAIMSANEVSNILFRQSCNKKQMWSEHGFDYYFDVVTEKQDIFS